MYMHFVRNAVFIIITLFIISKRAIHCSTLLANTIDNQQRVDGWMFDRLPHKIYIQLPSLFPAYLGVHSVWSVLKEFLMHSEDFFWLLASQYLDFL